MLDAIAALIELLSHFAAGVRKLLGLAPKEQSRLLQAGDLVIALLVIVVVVFATVAGLVWLLTRGS